MNFCIVTGRKNHAIAVKPNFTVYLASKVTLEEFIWIECTLYKFLRPVADAYVRDEGICKVHSVRLNSV